MQNENYEMIMCIVNAGCTDTVMDAARAAGASGGTVIHGRGTANKEAEKLFKISVQPEKDMVMLIVPARIKDKVLHAIYKNAGLESEGQGIAFSVPVNNAVGLSHHEPDAVKEGESER
ncbi:MAG: P-II family nitrogen regulator [Clostridia bacterium]|nr:P-II family nitrogen regulator [Clostridia bacterium]